MKRLNLSEYQLFRYPGGKRNLLRLPPFEKEVQELISGASEMYEMFCGAASVSLYAALRNPNIHITLVEADPLMSGFWHSIEFRHVEKLVEMLDEFPTTTEEALKEFNHLRATNPVSNIECAYQAVVFNRMSFSGILDASPIGGKNQTGKYDILCRFNPRLLAKKLRLLSDLLDNRVTVYEEDALWCLKTFGFKRDSAIYLDPPYVRVGDGLYPEKMTLSQHEELAHLLLKLKTPWLLSYNDCPEVREWYAGAQIVEIPVRYPIRVDVGWIEKKELLIKPHAASK